MDKSRNDMNKRGNQRGRVPKYSWPISVSEEEFKLAMAREGVRASDAEIYSHHCRDCKSAFAITLEYNRNARTQAQIDSGRKIASQIAAAIGGPVIENVFDYVCPASESDRKKAHEAAVEPDNQTEEEYADRIIAAYRAHRCGGAWTGFIESPQLGRNKSLLLDRPSNTAGIKEPHMSWGWDLRTAATKKEGSGKIVSMDIDVILVDDSDKVVGVVELKEMINQNYGIRYSYTRCLAVRLGVPGFGFFAQSLWGKSAKLTPNPYATRAAIVDVYDRMPSVFRGTWGECSAIIAGRVRAQS